MNNPIGASLVDWYHQHKRTLPWRYDGERKPDPYRVWVSEIMLQQTTVAGVMPYFSRFMQQYPNVGRLAAAPQAEVLDMWAGLGYYARARNMHSCAQKITAEFGGRFPADEKILRSLPGIGDYTAAAIMAIAFNKPAVALDGNGKRVLARLFAETKDLKTIDKQLRRHYADIFYTPEPSAFAQAMMDLGATICTPTSPQCLTCPVRKHCRGKERWHEIPHRADKAALPMRYGVLLDICNKQGAVLLRRRPPKAMLGGCLEFIGSRWDNKQNESDPNLWQGDLQALLQKLNSDEKALQELPDVVEHGFTHYKLQLQLRRLTLSDKAFVKASKTIEGAFIVEQKDFADLSFPSLMRKAAKLFSAA